MILRDDGAWQYAEAESPSQDHQGDLDECANWITVEKDTVTSTIMVAGSAPIVVSDDGGETGFTINLMRSSPPESSITLSIAVVGGGAVVTKGDGICFFFTDGTHFELANQESFNFKGRMAMHLGGAFGMESALRQLAEKRIGMMGEWTGESYHQRDLTPEMAASFRNMMRCLAEYKYRYSRLTILCIRRRPE